MAKKTGKMRAKAGKAVAPTAPVEPKGGETTAPALVVGVGASAGGLDLPLRPQNKPAVAIPAVPRTRLTLPAMAYQAVAERYGPAAAVVDRKGTLLYTLGNIRDFLEAPLGESTGLLAEAAREELQNRVDGALAQAVAENKKVVVQARVRKDKKSVPVKVTVSPMRNPREAEGFPR